MIQLVKKKFVRAIRLYMAYTQVTLLIVLFQVRFSRYVPCIDSTMSQAMMHGWQYRRFPRKLTGYRLYPDMAERSIAELGRVIHRAFGARSKFHLS